MTSPPALAKHSASSGTESPPQDLPIREGRRREGYTRRSPNSPFFTENDLKMQQFRHRRALSRHQNERQKTSAVISGDFDGALTTPLPRLFLSPQWEVVPRRARGVIRLYWNRICINKNNHVCWLCCNQTTTAATPAQTLMLTWALMSASAPIRLLAVYAPTDHVHLARHPPSMRLQCPLSQKVASTR